MVLMGNVESSKPKKQRKFHYSKPLHRKQQGLAVHLDRKLRQELGARSIPVRKNDGVKVVRGSKRGTSGKVTAVNYMGGTVFIDKVLRKKANGEEVQVPVNASNLLLVDADRSDARRFKRKKAKKPAGEKEGKVQ